MKTKVETLPLLGLPIYVELPINWNLYLGPQELNHPYLEIHATTPPRVIGYCQLLQNPGRLAVTLKIGEEASISVEIVNFTLESGEIIPIPKITQKK